MKRNIFLVVAIIIALSLVWGCQQKQPGTVTEGGQTTVDYSKLSPTQVFETFSNMVVEGKYETAWLLLSDESKTQMAESEKAMKELEAAMGELEGLTTEEEVTEDTTVEGADAAAAAAEAVEEKKEEVKEEEAVEPGFGLFKQAMTEVMADEETKKEIQAQKVVKEEIAEDGNTATLEVQVKMSEEEEPETNTIHLVKQENGWKLDMTR
jgi:hypothetical protein